MQEMRTHDYLCSKCRNGIGQGKLVDNSMHPSMSFDSFWHMSAQVKIDQRYIIICTCSYSKVKFNDMAFCFSLAKEGSTSSSAHHVRRAHAAHTRGKRSLPSKYKRLRRKAPGGLWSGAEKQPWLTSNILSLTGCQILSVGQLPS